MNKKITGILMAGYGLLLGYSACVNGTFQTGYHLDYFLVALFAPWVAHFVFKWMKLTMTAPMIVTNWVFCACSTILGSTLGFYRYAYFDKMLHFSSGFFISMSGVMVYALLHVLPMNSKKECILQLLFLNGMNMLIAFLWELYEFGLLVFLDIDAVNHYTTGVFDTMGDMFVCFLGGLVFSFFTCRYYRTKKVNVFYKIVFDFKQINERFGLQ